MTSGDSLLEAYPLTWPEHTQRTAPRNRRSGNFKVTLGRARDELLGELRQLGAVQVIISSNLPLRRDGLPYADAREPQDSGVAVYFKRKLKPYVIACDSYTRVYANIRAIGATVEALRTIERHGSSEMLEQAFTGFAALPPARAADPSWWDVLSVRPEASPAEIKAARDLKALQVHPDVGGSDEEMARVNRAYQTAVEERGSVAT